MISIDAYLTAVHRGLGGMDPGVRKDILLELRSHLTDSVGANGGNVGAAIQALGDPESVARRYRELYGYSSSYRLLFTAIAGIVGAFTVPVLFFGEAGIFPFFVSAFFLSIEFIFLIWVSTAAGNRAGLLAGVTAAVGRLAGFGVAVAVNRDTFLITPDGLAAFLLVSLLLIFVGWIPGKAKKAWGRPPPEL